MPKVIVKCRKHSECRVWAEFTVEGEKDAMSVLEAFEGTPCAWPYGLHWVGGHTASLSARIEDAT